MLKTENQTKVYIYFEDSLETSPKTNRKQPPTWTYPPTHSQMQIRNVNGDYAYVAKNVETIRDQK